MKTHRETGAKFPPEIDDMIRLGCSVLDLLSALELAEQQGYGKYYAVMCPAKKAKLDARISGEGGVYVGEVGSIYPSKINDARVYEVYHQAPDGHVLEIWYDWKWAKGQKSAWTILTDAQKKRLERMKTAQKESTP